MQNNTEWYEAQSLAYLEAAGATSTPSKAKIHRDIAQVYATLCLASATDTNTRVLERVQNRGI